MLERLPVGGPQRATCKKPAPEIEVCLLLQRQVFEAPLLSEDEEGIQQPHLAEHGDLLEEVRLSRSNLGVPSRTRW